MIDVAVVIPLDPDTCLRDGHRGVAYDFVRQQLDGIEWPVIPGVCDTEPWCKARAVEDGLRYTTSADVIVVHDADVFVNQRALRTAVVAVREERAEWAVPHRLVHRLDEETSEATIVRGMVPTSPRTLVRWPYVGVPGGGVVVLRRSTYDDCPLDPRFLGWGNEDVSWGWALTCLHGEPWRGEADLFHLFHPHAAPGASRSPLFESERLRRAYRAYRTRPDQMRALIEGARESV